MLDSIHNATHENLLLGEGVLLAGFDLDSMMQADDPSSALAAFMEDKAHLLGATQEGCVFRCGPRLLDTTRGHRTPAEGETLNGPWQATLSGTLLEITPANAAMLLNLPLPAGADGLTVLTPEASPFAGSTEKICWVGTSGSGMLAIELTAPVSTGGMTLRATPRGLGEMAFTLTARKQSPADTALPFRIAWLKGGAA